MIRRPPISPLFPYTPLSRSFDSMRTAEARRRGEAPADPFESWSKDRPIGPIILIVVGVLFLLNNFNWFRFYQIERFWPLVLIADRKSTRLNSSHGYISYAVF